MTAPQPARYQWGQAVQAVLDLSNDGSFPEWPADALLVRQGDRGEIVQIGTHIDSNSTIYLVEFGGRRVVGCLENEIAAVPFREPAIASEDQRR